MTAFLKDIKDTLQQFKPPSPPPTPTSGCFSLLCPALEETWEQGCANFNQLLYSLSLIKF